MPLLWTPSHVIADVTLTAHAQTIDVANLDYNNDGPWQLYLGTRNPQGSSTNIDLLFNGDYTLTNYYSQWLRALATGRYSARINHPGISYLTAGGSQISFGIIMVCPASYARYRGTNCRYRTTTLDIIEYGTCKSSTVANITSLRIRSSIANGLGSGTRLILTRIAH